MTMNFATPSLLFQSCATCRAPSVNAAVFYSSVSKCFCEAICGGMGTASRGKRRVLLLSWLAYPPETALGK
jgi:hypothetical protein